MTRASRHLIPGHVWHLTYRCHKREFLLKFFQDRNRLVELLFEAKKRYRLIDHDQLRRLLHADTNEALAQAHRVWVESQLQAKRQKWYTKSLAVGSEDFTKSVQQTTGIRAFCIRISKTGVTGYQLKESIAEYGSADSDKIDSDLAFPDIKKIPLKLEDALEW